MYVLKIWCHLKYELKSYEPYLDTLKLQLTRTVWSRGDAVKVH